MQQYFLGIDGGGSKCKAVITDENLNILGEGLAGGANPFHHVENAQKSIVLATELALKDANMPLEHISKLIAGVGLAGVNVSKYFHIMENWQHPFAQMYLATDLDIACIGAHNGGVGAIIITGTGSCAYSNAGVKPLIVGGHGFPQGDKCSGAWLGFKAIESVLLADDALVPETVLTKAVFERLGCQSIDDLIERVAGQGATFYGQMARDVLDGADNGDSVCIEIIKEGCAYFIRVYNKLMNSGQSPLAIIGGIGPRLQAWLPAEINNNIINAQNPPEIGAVLMAFNRQNNAIAI